MLFFGSHVVGLFFEAHLRCFLISLSFSRSLSLFCPRLSQISFASFRWDCLPEKEGLVKYSAHGLNRAFTPCIGSQSARDTHTNTHTHIPTHTHTHTAPPPPPRATICSVLLVLCLPHSMFPYLNPSLSSHCY